MKIARIGLETSLSEPTRLFPAAGALLIRCAGLRLFALRFAMKSAGARRGRYRFSSGGLAGGCGGASL